MQLLHESVTDASFNPNDVQHVESQVFLSKEHAATSKGAAYLVGRSQFGLQHDIENELLPVDVLLQIICPFCVWADVQSTDGICATHQWYS